MNPNRRVQYLAAFAVSLATMTNSASYSWTTPILPKLHNNEIIPNITSTELSWIVAILPLGMVIGAIVASGVADKFGRRTTLLISAFPYVIGAVLVLFATKAWMLFVARALWGCGAGMINTVSSIYLSEIADKDIRGTLTAITRFMFNAGALLVLVIASIVSYQVLTSLLLILPACYFIACWRIPETPYFLLKVGKVDLARKAMVKLSGCKDDKMIEGKLSLMRSSVRKEMARSSSVRELITGKPYRRAIIITIGLRVTQIMTGTIPIQQYIGRIIQQSNCGLEVSTALIIFGTVRFVVGFTSPLIVDRVGRRPLLIYTYVAACIVLIIVGFYNFIQEVIGIDDKSANPFRYTVFIGIIVLNIIASIGFDTLIFIIPSEIFPLNVKSTAMTAGNIFSASVSFVVVKGYQNMVDLTGLYGVFWFYATMALSGAVFTYFVVPETKGKSLREIQKELQGNIYDESNEKLNKPEIVNDDIENNIITELHDITSKASK